MSILSVAKRLKNHNMDALVKPYLETTVSKRRVLLVSALILYVLFIEKASKSPVLLNEAKSVLPVLVGLLVLSIVWAALIRKTALKDNYFINGVGSLMDFIGIWSLLSFAWNIMLIMVPVIIGVVITTGARYSPKYFYTAIGLSIAVVLGGAPHHYWYSRPVFAVLAVALLVALPLTVFKLLQTLRIISEIAIKSSESQARFINTVSHELRTPLNSVITGSVLLYDATLNDTEISIVKLIEANGRYLLTQVNQILEHAITSQNDVLIIDDFELSKVLNEVEAYVGVNALDKNISLVFVSELENDIVRGDRQIVCNVLNNLVGNAVKYSDWDTVVSLSVSRTSPKQIKIVVADQGCGIPDDKKPFIFDLFYRIGDKQIESGFGFGLNLVKTCSDKLGATITVCDNVPKGTVFEWLVPLEVSFASIKSEKFTLIDTLIIEHKKTLKSLGCLIVDDNSSNCLVLRELLIKFGHTVTVVNNGEDVPDVLLSLGIDLIILDINLGSMSGWDVLDKMKLMTLTKKPKVIISSAAVLLEGNSEAMLNGADASLSKPIDPRKLIALIEEIFEPSMMLKHKPATPNDLQLPLAMIKSMSDEITLNEYLACNRDDLNQSHEFFVHDEDFAASDFCYQVHFLKNVMNSLDMMNESYLCQGLHNQVRNGGVVSKDDLRSIRKMISDGYTKIQDNLAVSKVH